MSTKIWLTDEDADIAGYKRAKIGEKSSTSSLVRSVTTTPSNSAITRSAAGQGLVWITDPLNGPALTAAVWELHLWAYSDLVATLNLQVLRFTNQESSAIVTSTTSALGSTLKDTAFNSDPATATSFEVGDRLVFKVSVNNVLAVGHIYVSYNGLYPRAEGDSYLLCPDSVGTLNDFRMEDINTIREMLRDVDTGYSVRLSDDQIKRCLKQAINTYTVNRPRKIASFISGTGTSYEFPLPNKWVWGFSRVIDLEYPSGEQIPRMLDTIDWEVREDLIGVQPVRKLKFKTITPDNGIENVLITYTTKHDYNEEINTIAGEDFDAVLWLAASYCASELASAGAGSVDSSLQADVVNYRDMVARWGSVARTFLELYEKRVVRPDSATPVGTTEEWKPILSTGYNFLWHGRRVRRVR